MNAVDSVFNRSESLSLARMSMHEASPYPVSTLDQEQGGSETEKESALLDGSVNEEGQLNKEEDNGLEVRVDQESGSGGKVSCSLDGLDVHCAKLWTGRFRIGAL